MRRPTQPAEPTWPSEPGYRRLFESNPLPMWVYSLETLRILAVNDAAIAQYGYSRGEFLGLTIKELCLPEHVLRLLHTLDDARAGRCDLGSHQPVRWRHCRKDQTCFDAEIRAHPVMWNGHRAELVLAQDVSERARAERRAAVFAQCLQQLNASTTLEQAGRVIVCAAEELLGWDACLLYLFDTARDQARCLVAMETRPDGQKTDVPVSVFGNTPSPLLRCVLENGKQLMQRAAQNVMPAPAVSCDSSPRLAASLMWVTLRLGADTIGALSIQSALPLAYDEEGLEALQDLANLGAATLARLQGQASLRASEARCQLLSENQSDGLCILDAEGRFLSVNPAAERLLGTPPGTLMGRTLGEFVCGEQRELLCRQSERCLWGESVTCDLSVTLPDSQARVLHVARIPQANAAGRHLQALCLIRDVTLQRRAERLAAQAQLRLQALWDAAPVPLRLTDADGSIVMTNRAYCDLVGLPRERLEGHPLTVAHCPANQQSPLEGHARWFEDNPPPSHHTAEVIFWDGKRAALQVAESVLRLPGEPPLLLSVVQDTTFPVVVSRPGQQPTRTSRLPETLDCPPNGRIKTILAVEDEEFLREVNSTILQRQGYRVLVAESGPQALELARTGERIDLLFTDLVLPGDMSGRELARTLQARQPDLRVLFTSGFSGGTGDTAFLQRPDTHFLPKPFSADKLCQHVARCLEAEKSAAADTPASPNAP